MRTTRWGALVGAVVLALAAGLAVVLAPRVRRHLAIDACLDAGGAWDYEHDACDDAAGGRG